VNTLPLPGVLRSWISPPRRFASSRLIASPKPVPPYLRLVPASRLLEGLEDDALFLRRDAYAGSDTSNDTTEGACRRVGWSAFQPLTAGATASLTRPRP